MTALKRCDLLQTNVLKSNSSSLYSDKLPDEIIATIASNLDLQSSKNFAKVLKNRRFRIINKTPQKEELDNLILLHKLLLTTQEFQEKSFIYERLNFLNLFQAQKLKTLSAIAKFNILFLDELLDFLIKLSIEQLKNLKAETKKEFPDKVFLQDIFELAILFRINVVTLSNIRRVPLDVVREVHNIGCSFSEINAYCIRQIILYWIEIGEIHSALEYIVELKLDHATLQNIAKKLAQLGFLKEAFKVIKMIPHDMQKYALYKISEELDVFDLKKIIPKSKFKKLVEFFKKTRFS